MKITLGLKILTTLLYAINTKVESQQFCSNSEEVITVFSMGNTIYLQKGRVFYTKTLSEKFMGKTPVDANTMFTNGLKRISTGFFISAIPSCDENCEHLTKLDKTVFVIGFRPNTVKQSYIAFKATEDRTSVIPIKSDSEMPFEMRAQTKVDGVFWPRSSDEDIIYLASAFDSREHSIVHILEERGEIVVYINELLTITKEWRKETKPTVHPMNEVIKKFKGFIQTANRDTYALVQLENPSGDTLVTFNILTRLFPKRFVQVFYQRVNCNHLTLSLKANITLTNDIYGCPLVVSTTTAIPLKDDAVPVNTQTGSPSAGADTVGNGSNSISDSNQRTTKSPKNGNNLEPEAVKTRPKGKKEKISNDKEVLLWIFIVTSIIAFILFMVMISTVLYIRHDNLIIKEERKRLLSRRK